MKRAEKITTLNAQYTCTFRPEPEGGYTVLCDAFLGLVSQGRTLDEARSNAREALELCIDVYQRKNRTLPPSEDEPRRTIKEAIPVKLAVV